MSGTRVFHRHLHHTPPLAVGGSGVWLTDSAGKQYLDASGGAAVSCLGHGHPDVLAAMHTQIDSLAYAHTRFFTTQVAEDLAQHLIERAPDGMSHAYFVSGGSEGIEAAMKMARQYFVVPATHVSACYPYREQEKQETPEQYGLRLAREVDATFYLPALVLIGLVWLTQGVRMRARTVTA